MNRLKHIAIILVAIIGFTACKNDTEQPEIKTVVMDTTETSSKKQLDPNATYAKVEFGIEGMTCAMGCAKTIERKMAKMDGVKSAKVDFDKRLAMVEYDQAKVTPKSLEATVTKVGEMYKVQEIRKVDAFGEKSTSCKPGCKKDKTTCKAMSKAEKTACKADCKKACCKDHKA